MERDPRSKPRNPAVTRSRILAAAQRSFVDVGYAQTGLRDVAQAAGVASSLVISYFGTKAGLFEAALIEALQIKVVTRGQRARFGRDIVRYLDNPESDVRLPGMIAQSIGDPEALAITRRITRDRLVGQTADWLGPPRARARAMTILSMSIGYVIQCRYLLTEETASARRDAARMLSRSLQALVDEGRDPPALPPR